MPIPETPPAVRELDLMRRLESYAEGEANWDPEGAALGEKAKTACRCLHTNITDLVDKALGPLMDKVTTREMETFTLHDRTHGLKVAHLMWQILAPERRERLTPPEIAMLVLAAHLHDLGMGLSPDERQARLEGSEIWERAEWDESTKTRLKQLRTKLLDPKLADTARRRLEHQLFQAEEVLLCEDTRERHATLERYEELLRTVRGLHDRDREQIPDPDSCLAFDGDSFCAKLLDVCVSHNEDAEVLAHRDRKNLGYSRFPRDYAVGCATANLQMVAAALRLADILDFDRERTPPALFLYLMPGPLAPEENRAVLEWSKHLSISHWNIDESAIVFKGRCRNHIVHHAVVQFCAAITDEIQKTKLTFGSEDPSLWPFLLPSEAKAEIHAEGYKYVPYRFELDDERIYSLLMGGAIYDNPLVAVRELVQNAVDACKLRDALMQLSEPGVQMPVRDRIFVRYEEPKPECPQPKLSVRDTGTGMDELILRTYFLKVGQSYYRSTEFNKHRVKLRKAGLDFAPVSEFGIGFLSCFLLADRVKVETAMAEGWSEDIRKRTVVIDGPTRLIRLDEEPNVGQRRWKGTQVTLYLTRGGIEDRKNRPPAWNEIKYYLADVCQELPYDLHLEHENGTTSRDVIPSGEKSLEVPPDLAACALRIPINDPAAGLEGELVLVNEFERERRLRAEAKNISGRIAREGRPVETTLLRGGFRIGALPGLSDSFLGRVRLNWRSQDSRRYAVSNLARNAMGDRPAVAEALFRNWLTYLLDHRSELSGDLFASMEAWEDELPIRAWLEQHDAASLYQLARKGWLVDLERHELNEQDLRAWEMGRGSSLPRSSRHALKWQLLDLVLPRITSRELDEKGEVLLRPPQQGGLESLDNCRDYVRQPVSWGVFAAFPATRARWLAGGSLTETWFSEKYRRELSAVFREEEYGALARTVGKLIVNRVFSHLSTFTPEEAGLWRRLAEHFRDYRIGWCFRSNKSWRIDSFKIAERP